MVERCILSVKYVPAGGARRLGGFLRYVQFRDQHTDRALGGLTRYIAHRDRAAPSGRLFGPQGNCGDLDRRALLAHVSRSLRQGGGGKHPRAAYRMVLSPERDDGLDLKAMTRAAMNALGREVGGAPPWIAAIHRNTKHPHVHIVMAARREREPGGFRTVIITRERLASMKGALAEELMRERGGRPAHIRLNDFVPDLHVGASDVRRRHGQLVGLVGDLTRIIDKAIHALAAHQRRELQRWMVEEERRLKEQQRRQRSLLFER